MVKNRAGFTMVEIIVSLLILGIIIAASVTMIDPVGQIAKSRDARRRADLEDIRTALEMYRVDCGSYPNGNADGQLFSDDTIAGTTGVDGCPATISYMDDIPFDPSSDDGSERQYVYYSPTGGDAYFLCAHMETQDLTAVTSCDPGGTDANDCIAECNLVMTEP